MNSSAISARNGCHLEWDQRQNWNASSCNIVHNPTRFHQNNWRTLRVILYAVKRTEGKTAPVGWRWWHVHGNVRHCVTNSEYCQCQCNQLPEKARLRNNPVLGQSLTKSAPLLLRIKLQQKMHATHANCNFFMRNILHLVLRDTIQN